MTRIDELTDTLTRARFDYYQRPGACLMDDSEYDRLEAELKTLDPNNPLLHQVGVTVPSILDKALHHMHMGSQNKAKTTAEFAAWLKGCGNRPVVGMLKLDGFSLEVRYKDGLFIQAITRGDGEIGEDVSANASCFQDLPLLSAHGFTGSVRGEGILRLLDWAKVDPDMTSNPRNLAAGIGGRKDGENCELITFIGYDVKPDPAWNESTLNNELDKLVLLNELGFSVVPHGVFMDLAQCEEYFRGVVSGRSKLPYWIDGVVFKINDLDVQEELGINGDDCPNGQVAWKFIAEEATTTVENVEITVGHTGKMVPTAVLRPVLLGGTTVSHALLCNWEEIARLNVAIGDQVAIIKGGEIIPKIVRVLHRPEGYMMPAGLPNAGGRKLIDAPTKCPVCGGPVGKMKNTDDSDTADLYCLSDECAAKQKGKIKRWIKSLGIKEIGEEVLEALTSTPLTVFFPEGDNCHMGGVVRKSSERVISKIADLYNLASLSAATIGALPVNGKKLGVKRAATIVAEIDKTRTLTIDQFLGSLGIAKLGKRRVKLIREAARAICPEVDALSKVDGWLRAAPACGSYLIQFADKLSIPGIAGEIQRDLDKRRDEIELLLKSITIVKPAPAPAAGGPLAGRAFCLTGAMAKARKEVAAAIQAAGGVVKDDVASGVTLVQADPTSKSSKSSKASKLGCQIMSEGALWKLIQKVAA